LGEALERFAASEMDPSRVEMITAAELRDAEWPLEATAAFSEANYQLPGFPFVPADQVERLRVVRGQWLDTCRRRAASGRAEARVRSLALPSSDAVMETIVMTPKELPDELLEGAPNWPLSRLFHEQSKLGPWRLPAFAEQLEQYASDMAAAGTTRDSGKTYPTMPAVELPRSHRWQGGHRLRDVLRTRRSQRGPPSGRPIWRAS
jgi:hypothetical protein